MAYRFMVLLDPEEGFQVDKNNCVRFTQNPEHIEILAREIAQYNSIGTILVYELAQMRKLKTKPTYQRYNVKSGEIVPE